MEELMIKVNALLRKEELRAKECFLKLKRNPEEMLRKNEISDYETDLKLQFYSNNEAINTKYGVEKGDPFTKPCCSLQVCLKMTSFLIWIGQLMD